MASTSNGDEQQIGQPAFGERAVQGDQWLARRRREGRRVGQRTTSWFRNLPIEVERHEFLREKRDKLQYITDQLDNAGFDWRVFLVASSGFLTDSYILFVTNTVIPTIIFVYMNNDVEAARSFWLWTNVSTLLGSICGQIVFGILADAVGRTALYGWELIIVIFSTVGFGLSSRGFSPSPSTSAVGPSLNIEALFYSFRFIMGIGIGAEYPLSAVLTAEWASTKYRARMLAAVFAMQPLGQLFGAIAGLSAIQILEDVYNVRSLPPEAAQRYVDGIWRGIVFFGVLPSVIALAFRFAITDPGRYTLEVQEDVDRAVEDTESLVLRKRLWPWNRQSVRQRALELQENARRGVADPSAAPAGHNTHSHDTNQSFGDLYRYLVEEGNIWLVFGACANWFVLDIAFFGLGISSPYTLALIWADWAPRPGATSTQPVPPWNPDPTMSASDIYDVLMENAKRQILTSIIGSLVGSTLLIVFILQIRRKTLLQWSFLALFACLLATGLSLRYDFGTKRWPITYVFYVISHILFNFGPNTLTFMFSAEIFPTRYRCSFYGLAAASGKAGSVIIQAVLSSALQDKGNPALFEKHARTLSNVLIGFSFAMAVGFPITKIFIPEVQHRRKRGDSTIINKSLEELEPGMEAAQRDNQLLGPAWFLGKWLRLRRPRNDDRSGWARPQTQASLESNSARTEPGISLERFSHHSSHTTSS